MVELVYTQDLKFCDRKVMWVRFPPRAHVAKNPKQLGFFVTCADRSYVLLAGKISEVGPRKFQFDETGIIHGH